MELFVCSQWLYYEGAKGGVWPGLGVGAGGCHAMFSPTAFFASSLGTRLSYAHINLHGHVPCSQLAVPRLSS